MSAEHRLAAAAWTLLVVSVSYAWRPLAPESPPSQVPSSTTLTCGATVLRVQHSANQLGASWYFYDEVLVHSVPPGPRIEIWPGAMVGTWREPGEIPAHVSTRPLGAGELAWMVHAPDPAQYACLVERILELRAALHPGPHGETEVVVWSARHADVWPEFRRRGARVRVREDGRVEVESYRRGVEVAYTLGDVTRDADGARILTYRGDPRILEVAVDGKGRTLLDRYPARLVEAGRTR